MPVFKFKSKKQKIVVERMTSKGDELMLQQRDGAIILHHFFVSNGKDAVRRVMVGPLGGIKSFINGSWK